MSIVISLKPLTDLIDALNAKGLVLTHGPYIGEEILRNKELIDTSDEFCNAVDLAIVSLHEISRAPITEFHEDGTVTTQDLGIDDIPAVCIGTNSCNTPDGIAEGLRPLCYIYALLSFFCLLSAQVCA